MNIYVGNISYQIGEDELKQIFEEFGEVSSAKIITDKYSGRSKGFGFIVMDNDEEAASAIKNLNGKEINNRQIVVNEARPRQE
ncbi:MAG: RNA recognition motif domain-containing protein [Bacteroidota bacterium]